MMYDLSKFGQRLREERKRKFLTQQQLSEKTNIYQHYISAYERNEIMPTMINLIVLATELGCSAGYLLGGDYD